MPRFARLFAVTVAEASLVGVTAAVALACPGSKTDADKASAGTSCSSKASTQMASAGTGCTSGASVEKAAAGQCATKTGAQASSGCCPWSKQAMASGADCGKVCADAISAMASLEPFKFLKDVNAQQVNLAVETTDNGFAFVFAAVNDGDVAMAKQAATQSMEMISTPAHCSKTRGAMAQNGSGCEYTQACLSALADADVQMVETEHGAKTLVVAKDEAKVKELHAFLSSLVPVAQPTGKS